MSSDWSATCCGRWSSRCSRSRVRPGEVGPGDHECRIGPLGRDRVRAQDRDQLERPSRRARLRVRGHLLAAAARVARRSNDPALRAHHCRALDCLAPTFPARSSRARPTAPRRTGPRRAKTSRRRPSWRQSTPAPPPVPLAVPPTAERRAARRSTYPMASPCSAVCPRSPTVRLHRSVGNRSATDDDERLDDLVRWSTHGLAEVGAERDDDQVW